jgi:hypothetical protein
LLRNGRVQLLTRSTKGRGSTYPSPTNRHRIPPTPPLNKQRQARDAAKPSILSHLEALEDHLPKAGDGRSLLGAPALTLADVAVSCALLPLWQGVLGADVRAAFPAVTAWLTATAGSADFASVIGPLKLCGAASGWVEPAAADGDKKKKKKKGAAGSEGDGAQQQAAAERAVASPTEDDPEKAAKKVGG